MEKPEIESPIEPEKELEKEEVKQDEDDIKSDQKITEPDLLDLSNITVDAFGKCETTVHVAEDYYKNLIGFGGKYQKKLEYDTNTTIYVPKKWQKHLDVSITGTTKIDVARAKKRIASIVKNARLKHRPTHFLSLPLSGPMLQEKIIEFKREVLKSIPEIKENYFVSPTRLHLTLGVFAICDDVEKEEFTKVIQETCSSVFHKTLQNKKLLLNVKGISRFSNLKSDDKIKIIFANVTSEQEGLLEEMYQNIKSQLCDKGIMNPVKGSELHLTLIKAKNVGKRKEFFDATNLLKMYGEFDFGSVLVDRVDVAVIGSSDVDSEYYEVIESVPIETVSPD